MKISHGDAVDALGRLGRNETARNILIEALKQIEPYLEQPDFEVREMVTGPICDALFEHGADITRTLADGTIISARYTSKIIRDFVMAEGEHPELVWEPQTTRALLGFAANATQILIGGAYIGDHAVLLAKQMPAEGIVHCFEPSADSPDCSPRTPNQNGLTNIRINKLGLWASDAQLVLEGDDSHASPVVASGQADAFRAISIDRYGEDQGIEDLDLIVLDIEGGEIEALRGASTYLAAPFRARP